MGKGSTFTCYFPVRQPDDSADSGGGGGDGSCAASDAGGGEPVSWDDTASPMDVTSVVSYGEGSSPAAPGRSLTEIDEQIAALRAARDKMAKEGNTAPESNT